MAQDQTGMGCEARVETPAIAQHVLRFLARTTANLWWVVAWPARVVAARRTLQLFANMSEHELRDIGLGAGDILALVALPRDKDPGRVLSQHVQARRAQRPNSVCKTPENG